MKFRRGILMSLTIWLFVACNNVQKVDLTYQWDDKTRPVRTIVVPSDSMLLHTGGMEIMGDCFLMYNISQPDNFSYYKLRNDSLIFISALQKRGRGPYEALFSRAVFMSECNELYLIDQSTGRKAYAIAADNEGFLADVKAWEVVDLSVNQNIRSIIPTGCDGTFVGQLMDDRQHMFGLLSVLDSAVTPIDLPYPETGVDCSDISLGMAFLGTLTKRPNGENYVFSAQNSRYVMLFSLKDNMPSDVKIIYNTPPQFTLASDEINIKQTGDIPSGFYVQVTADYIYLTPRNHREVDRNILENHPSFGLGYETLVFDWDGEPVKKILTDRPVQSIAITDNDQFLYAKYTDTMTMQECIVKGRLQ